MEKIFEKILKFKWYVIAFSVFILGITLLTILFNILFPKSWTIKTYDYKIPKETAYKWGKTGGRLIWTDSHEDGFQSITGSPYDLFLWVELKKEGLKKTVVLENLIIRDLETNKIIAQRDTLQGDLENDTISFDMKKIIKDYHSIGVSFDLTIDNTKEKVLFKFEKDYSERKVNKGWEILMGV